MRRPRTLTVLILICALFVGYRVYEGTGDYVSIGLWSSGYRNNVLFNLAQELPWPLNIAAVRLSPDPSNGVGDLKLWPALLAAPSPYSFPLPSLVSSLDAPRTAENGAAFFALYIFSTASPSGRKRRNLIRSLSPLNTIPEAYKHLMDLKFVIGHPDPAKTYTSEMRVEERATRDEMAMYGDIVRLEGLLEGDNMNKGKSIEWLRWVGRQGRPAHWVFKCDDDVSVNFSL